MPNSPKQGEWEASTNYFELAGVLVATAAVVVLVALAKVPVLQLMEENPANHQGCIKP